MKNTNARTMELLTAESVLVILRNPQTKLANVSTGQACYIDPHEVTNGGAWCYTLGGKKEFLAVEELMAQWRFA